MFKVISDYIAIVSQHGIQKSLPYTTKKESLYRSGRGQRDALDVKGSCYSYRRPEIGSSHRGLKISCNSSSMDLMPSPGFCWQVHTGAHTHIQTLVHTQLKININHFVRARSGGGISSNPYMWFLLTGFSWHITAMAWNRVACHPDFTQTLTMCLQGVFLDISYVFFNWSESPNKSIRKVRMIHIKVRQQN